MRAGHVLAMGFAVPPACTGAEEAAMPPALVLVRGGGVAAVPRTWILTERDRALSVKLQRKGIEALGGVQTLIPIDTCHLLMVSEPDRLAEILVERVRLYG